MEANVPGFLPKTALVTSKLIYKPFLIPQKLTDSSTLVGHELNGMVAGVSAAVGTAYDNLQPRGPAKWLSALFHKVNDATVHSEQIAQRNKTVFWDPFSQGSESIGRAFAGPGAYWYLRKGGVEAPTADAIKGVLQTGLFKFPDPAGAAPAPEGPAPTATGGETPAGAQPGADAVVVAAGAPDGAGQAAEGAGSIPAGATA
ncbi:MAG: hypothetical protein JWM98_1929 [Thermoleophilia bacterium]|nr:hypothetical protein [Thermoleophilia bacterium]